jgi:hypothetical protein
MSIAILTVAPMDIALISAISIGAISRPESLAEK